jgi:DNA-directed RNA polymerase specialized sigma24 family protein
MQPPTESTSAGQRDTVDELYRRHHDELQRSVAGAVRAPSELIEDACQTAWMIMVRAQPQCHSAFGWLRTVAIHEAYRLLEPERQHATRGVRRPRTEQPLDLPATGSIDDTLDALEALRLLAALPKRQRTDLTLKIAGYSYNEIQAHTPGRTWTNVNHSLVKARALIGRWRS